MYLPPNLESDSSCPYLRVHTFEPLNISADVIHWKILFLRWKETHLHLFHSTANLKSLWHGTKLLFALQFLLRKIEERGKKKKKKKLSSSKWRFLCKAPFIFPSPFSPLSHYYISLAKHFPLCPSPSLILTEKSIWAQKGDAWCRAV